jgi:hypothetical protein
MLITGSLPGITGSAPEAEAVMLGDPLPESPLFGIMLLSTTYSSAT